MSLFRLSPDSHHESDRPSATPAEAGVHRSSSSLSEAFLDSSSARDALPEEYRTRFDELRNGILAFCKEFQIPSEALKSKETFGTYLNSPKIPQKRMAEAVLLFERLEHLVTHGEPLLEQGELPEALHLKEQYDAQVSLLEQAGILKNGAIKGIDGNFYFIPTLEQVMQRLYERHLETKYDQGFTKLLLVPFGMSLDALIRIFETFLLTYKKDHPDFDLDTKNPSHVWEGYRGADGSRSLSRLIYDTPDHPLQIPKEEEDVLEKRYLDFFEHRNFIDDSKKPGGETKTQILQDQQLHPDSSAPGWRILLLQAPQEGAPGFQGISRKKMQDIQGKKIPRPGVEGEKSPWDYFFLLQEAKGDPQSPYHKESGLTPEDWIIAFMTHLEETGHPLDQDYATTLTGAFFPDSKDVPGVFWFSERQQVDLYGCHFSNPQTATGTRFAVVV